MRWPSLTIAAVASLLLSPALAQPQPISEIERVAGELRDKALEGNVGYELAGEITTLFGPRLAGTDAERRAALWAALLWLIADSDVDFRAPPAPPQ